MSLPKVVKRFEVDCYEAQGVIILDVFPKPNGTSHDVARSSCLASLFNNMSECEKADWIAANTKSNILKLWEAVNV